MHLSIEDFRKEPATHIVSLGPRCATAHNLRRHFNFDTAYPFDWWISNSTAIARLLRDPDLDALYDPDRLELTWRGGSVRHAELGLLLHHEFPRDYAAAGEPVKPDFRDHVDKPKQKTRYLFERFFALDREGHRLLFVTECEGEAELTEALAQMLSRADWRLATVKGPAEDPSFGWRGDPQAWDAALAALGVTLDPSRHAPFKA